MINMKLHIHVKILLIISHLNKQQFMMDREEYLEPDFPPVTIVTDLDDANSCSSCRRVLTCKH